MFPTPSRGYANNGADEVNHRSAVLDTTFLISLADGKTTFKVVQLREGFDVAFVNGTGQSELPM